MSDPYAAATQKAASSLPVDPSVFDLPAFCAWAKVSRSTAFEEIAKGRLIVRRVGRKSLVTIEDARRWLNSLPTTRAA
jgi:hypothetical protein